MTRTEAKTALLAAYPNASIGITVSEVFSARAGGHWLDYHVCVNGTHMYKAGTLRAVVEQAIAAVGIQQQQTEAETDAHFEETAAECDIREGRMPF